MPMRSRGGAPPETLLGHKNDNAPAPRRGVINGERNREAPWRKAVHDQCRAFTVPLRCMAQQNSQHIVIHKKFTRTEMTSAVFGGGVLSDMQYRMHSVAIACNNASACCRLGWWSTRCRVPRCKKPDGVRHAPPSPRVLTFTGFCFINDPPPGFRPAVRLLPHLGAARIQPAHFA